MNTPYLYKGNSVVCTFQTSPSPQTLVTTRSKVTVFHKNDKTPLLTEDDKNIKVNFVCKLPVHLGASWLAFGIGLLAGAAVILSGPVGWVTIAVAVAATGGALYSISKAAPYIEEAINHTCSGHLGGGAWLLPHSSVEIDGISAVTQMSLLSCSNGGFLKPFMSPVLAKQAASDIMWANIKEISFNAVVSGFAGYLTVIGIGGASSATASVTLGKASIETAKFLGGTYIGIHIMTALTAVQKDYLRSDDDVEDHKNYDAMNKKDGNTYWSGFDFGLSELDYKIGGVVILGDTPAIDDPSDMSNPLDLQNFYEALNSKNGIKVVDNPALQSQLDGLKGKTRQALYRDPVARDILKRLNNGELPNIKNQIKNYNAKRITPKMREQMNVANQKQAIDRWNQGKKAFYGALYFIPFLNTYLSETVKKDILEAAWKDIEAANKEGSGTTVFAARPLG